MILLGLLAGVVTLLIPGMGITLLLMRNRARLNVLEAIVLSWLFGAGAVSLLLWLGGLLVSGPILQAGVGTLSLLLFLLGWRGTQNTGLRTTLSSPRTALEWCLSAGIVIEIALMFYISFKHGLGWDGLLNWEIKARYAFLNDGVVPAAYFGSQSRAFSHAEYPLFLPLTELWMYLWMGEAHQFWIKVLSPLFYAAGAGLLAIVATRLTGRRWIGLLSAALLFFVPCLTGWPGGVSVGYADVPLSVCYFTALGYLALFSVSKEQSHLRIYFASMALLPWVKQDGAILWAVAALCGTTIIWLRLRSLRPLLWLLPGPGIIIAWKVFLQTRHVIESKVFLAPTLATLTENFDRVLPIIGAVFGEMMEPIRWSLFWVLAGAAFLYLVVRRRDTLTFLLLAGVMGPIALYAATYLFSSWPDWMSHVNASFPRLLIHVALLGWLAVALALRPPMESTDIR